MGLNWKSSFSTGVNKDAITSGIEMSVLHPLRRSETTASFRSLYGNKYGVDEKSRWGLAVQRKGRCRCGTIPDLIQLIPAAWQRTPSHADDRPVDAVRPDLRMNYTLLVGAS